MIGGTLEYLMNSLPYLYFKNTEELKQHVLSIFKKYSDASSKEPGPIEILNSEARKFLSPSSYQAFQKLNLKNIHEEEFQKSKSLVLAAFANYTFQLKNEIKVWRTSQNESEKKIAQSRLEQITGDGSPLEKEIRIIQSQWAKVDELSGGHFADFEALVTYKIKLMLLLRWWSFDAESGFEKFINMTTNN